MKRSLPSQPVFRPALFAGFGLLLFALTLPAFGARLVRLSSDSLRPAIAGNGPVTDNDLSKWERAQRKALQWRETGETFDSLAMSALIKVQHASKTPALAAKFLKEALVWQRLALARAPANTFGWARLAYMQMQAEGLSQTAAAALALSLETGPYEPSLALARLSLALSLMNRLSPDLQARVPYMIRAAWELEPEELAKMARRENFISMAEQALLADPSALAAFREQLANGQP